MAEHSLCKRKVGGSTPPVGFLLLEIDHIVFELKYVSHERHSSLGVEHSLSKRKVVGSNPACGFVCLGFSPKKKGFRSKKCYLFYFILHFCGKVNLGCN